MSTSVNQLVQEYSSEITQIVQLIQKEGSNATPQVIAIILTEILPSLVKDVKNITSLAAADQKNLLVSALDLIIQQTISQSSLPQFEQEAIMKIITTVGNPLIEQFLTLTSSKIKSKLPQWCQCIKKSS